MKKSALMVVIMILVSSCSVQEILKTAGVSKPVVKFENVSLSSLTFNSIGLLFDFSIDNPNALGIDLAGFDYDLKINGSSFVSGNQPDKVTIPSRGKNNIQIPVSFTFSELINTYKSFENRDSVDYGLSGSFAFDLPILGKVSVPYSTNGNFPMIKIPAISISSLKLKNINVLGAEVELNLECSNPNKFSLGIDNFDYSFGVAGKEWVNSKYSKKIALNAGNKTEIRVPIKLNFLQVGSSVYNLLTGNAELDYFLKGDMNVSSGIPLLGSEILKLEKSGKIRLLK